MYPINTMKERLEQAVKSGQFFLNVPLVNGEAATAKITVTKMFALGAFDYLCHPYSSSPLTPQPTTEHATSTPGETTLTYMTLCIAFWLSADSYDKKGHIQEKEVPRLNWTFSYQSLNSSTILKCN